MSVNFYNKPVLLLAPDAKIYINSSFNIQNLPENDSYLNDIIQKSSNSDIFTGAYSNKVSYVNINNFFTSIDTSISTDGVDSASISFYFNKYEFSFLKRGLRTTFLPMSEISIYMKGRFLDKNGDPLYYRVFWGVIVLPSIAEDATGFKVSLSCQSMLYWLKKQFIVDKMGGVATSVFYTNNPEDNSNYLDVASLTVDKSPYEIIHTLGQQVGFPNIEVGNVLNLLSFIDENQTKLVKEYLPSIRAYWEIRLKEINANFKMFGFKGIKNPREVTEDSEKLVSKKRKLSDGVDLEDYIDSFVPKAIVEINSSIENVYKSKYDIIRQVSSAVQFEFFVDRTGEFIFKPPFYNMKISDDNQLYTIHPLDIINMQYSQNLSKIYNRIDVEGSLTGNNLAGGISSYFIDMKGVAELGFVATAPKVQARFIRSYDQAFYYAVGMLSRLNSYYISGSLTIKGRPELRLGYPVKVFTGRTVVYLYVIGIQHTFSVGGSFNTVLNFIAGRYPYLSPEGNDKNVFMVYKKGDDQTVYKDKKLEEKRQKLGDWEYQSGGTYDVESLNKKVPVSDEEGFTVVGGLPYGRGFTINKDNKVIESPPSKETGEDDFIDGESELPEEPILDLSDGVKALTGMQPEGSFDTAFRDVLKKLNEEPT